MVQRIIESNASVASPYLYNNVEKTVLFAVCCDRSACFGGLAQVEERKERYVAKDGRLSDCRVI